MFTLFIKSRTITAIRIFELARNRLQFANGGHKYYATNLELMKMAKTFNRSVTIVITTWTPAAQASVTICVRRQLGHSERKRCGGIKEPAAMNRSDLRINIGRRIKRVFFY